MGLTGLLAALALTVSGCQTTPSNVAYGMAWGAGEKVSTPTGKYQPYKVSEHTGFWNELVAATKSANGGNLPASWTEDDLIGGLRYSVDFLTTEFLDSTALEGGEQEYRQWFETTGKSHLDGPAYDRVAGGGPIVVVGRLGDKFFVPELIHDGKPRISRLHVQAIEAFPSVAEDNQEYLNYKLNFGADYRVTDANAAAIAAAHASEPMTAEDFINSPHAKEKLKDGKGENIYRMSGTATIYVAKNAQGEFKLIGLTHEDATFSTDDYTTE